MQPYLVKSPDSEDLVLCPKCNIERKLTQYYKHSLRKDGFIRYRPICKSCRKKVRSNPPRPITDKLIKTGKQICKYCNVEKLINEFYVNGCFNDGTKNYRARCKQCVINKLKSVYINTREQKINIRSKSPQNYMSGLLLKASHRKKEFNIDIYFLNELYALQQGLCAISGYKMTWQAGQGRLPYNISIDRKDPKIGYLKTNVHLVCSFINMMKNVMQLQEFLKMCQTIVKFNNLETYEENIQDTGVAEGGR
jgi:hypothetical protein